MDIELNDNCKLSIYNYIPVTKVKYCDKKTYDKYLNSFLPEKPDDWNIEEIIKKTSEPMLYLFYCKINNETIHNIYLKVMSLGLFDVRVNGKELFHIITDECKDDKHFFMPLPHHYLILQCLDDIINKRKYIKWLKSPEMK